MTIRTACALFVVAVALAGCGGNSGPQTREGGSGDENTISKDVGTNSNIPQGAKDAINSNVAPPPPPRNTGGN